MRRFLPYTNCFFFVMMFSFVHTHVRAQLTYNELAVQYDSPWTFKKLRLIPIRFKGPGGTANITAFNGNVISFSEALLKRKITVKEMSADGGPDVSMLMVKNHSQENIMLMSGEIVQGGKQDRAIGATRIILSGRHKNAVSVFCVEKGRWDDKAKKFKHAGTADADVRKQIDVSRRQK